MLAACRNAGEALRRGEALAQQQKELAQQQAAARSELLIALYDGSQAAARRLAAVAPAMRGARPAGRSP